jgi:hypothetical protein
LNDPFSRDEIVDLEVQVAKAEVPQDLQNTLGVLDRRAQKEVDVARESRMAVERHGVAANDEILNPARVQ